VSWLAALSAGALAAIATGFWLDAQRAPTQPMLFWGFVAFGLSGSALGWAFAVRNDRSPLRRGIAAAAALVAWRLAYFPLMVISGWKASLGEWMLHSLAGVAVVYPTFLLVIFAMNLVIGAIAGAAIAAPEGEAPRGALQPLRDLAHRPPRLALLALGVLALPVAAMVSFSKPSDLVLFGDRPWREPRPLPEIHDPQRNPYAVILREHEMALPARVLAWNALVTYPLVPESPWGGAMKGTLEHLALENPIATSQDRIDEHYLAYLAAHRRLNRDPAQVHTGG
jgi:hypothetical protein